MPRIIENDPPALVRAAEDTEQQLIDRAVEAVTRSAWVVGECASKWTQRWARGRTDADFGELVGLEQSDVNRKRKVYEKFGNVYVSMHNISWTHFLAALTWDDAEEQLRWADDNGASVAKMKDHRKPTEEDEPEPCGTLEEDRGGGGLSATTRQATVGERAFGAAPARRTAPGEATMVRRADRLLLLKMMDRALSGGGLFEADVVAAWQEIGWLDGRDVRREIELLGMLGHAAVPRPDRSGRECWHYANGVGPLFAANLPQPEAD